MYTTVSEREGAKIYEVEYLVVWKSSFVAN